MGAGAGLDQLGGDPDPLRLDLQAALEHVAHAELAADPAHVDALALERLDGVAGDDQEVAGAGELGDEVLGEGVGEPLLPLVAAEVIERQDGDRGAVECGRTARVGGAPQAVPPRSGGDGQGQQQGSRRQRRKAPGTVEGEPEPSRRPIEPDTVGTHQSLDVLDPLLAGKLQRQVELALELIVGGAGDDHAAGLGELLQARRDVHPVAVEVAVCFVDHVAEVDADAEADALRLRRPPPRVPPCPAG